MNQKRLKLIRLSIALLFFAGTCFVFLDFREILPDNLIKGVVFMQFVPSILKSFAVFGFATLGFIIVLLLTSLFGRVYCSTICPLGILQDLVGRIRKRTKQKHRYRYRKPNNVWRFTFLALPLLILVAGGGLIGIYLLDPYSIFGRFASDLGQPVYIWINNRMAGLLERMEIYLLNPEDIVLSGALTYVFPLLMLLTILWLSYKHGRLYCNTICPVGTLLGLLSKVSVFRIGIKESQCTKCGKCVIACKASCIDIKNQDVDFSRCVGCFNCIEACPEDAIGYLLAGSKGKQTVSIEPEAATETVPDAATETVSEDVPDAVPDVVPDVVPDAVPDVVPVNNGRRSAIFKLFTAPLVFAGVSSLVSGRNPAPDSDSTLNIRNKIPTKIKPEKTSPVSPPGSLGIEHFTDHCTACHLCISACPTGVLQPSLTQYGLAGFLQPHMDYATRYCNFDCTRCAEICPTGAILSLTKEAKKTAQIGKVSFIIENCIVKAENTACGSCSEHCPTQAVTMVPYQGNLTIPQIKPEICVGCGACEFACPVQPYKAIYVDGNAEHQVADKPVIEELEEIKMEEFPF